MAAALNACAELHKRGELDGSLEPVGRQSSFEFLAEDGVADGEVADGGIGPEGSVKRKRAYKRKVSLLTSSFFFIFVFLFCAFVSLAGFRCTPLSFFVGQGWGFFG